MGSWLVAASIPIPWAPPLLGTAQGLQGEEQRWLQATFMSHSPCQACLRCAGLQAAPRGPWCQPRVTSCNTFAFLPASSPWLRSRARGCSGAWQHIPPPAQEPSLLVPSPRRPRAARLPAPPRADMRQRGQLLAKAAGAEWLGSGRDGTR